MNEYKNYICVICGLIYDEEEGWPEDGIAPGTLWEMFHQTGIARIAARERGI